MRKSACTTASPASRLTPGADTGAVPSRATLTPSSGTDSAISTTALSRHFGDLVAVDKLSLSVWPGEIFGLIGSNGAGKSTLIKMLTTLCQRRLNVDPPRAGIAEVKLTHVEQPNQGDREGELPLAALLRFKLLVKGRGGLPFSIFREREAFCTYSLLKARTEVISDASTQGRHSLREPVYTFTAVDMKRRTSFVTASHSCATDNRDHRPPQTRGSAEFLSKDFSNVTNLADTMVWISRGGRDPLGREPARP